MEAASLNKAILHSDNSFHHTFSSIDRQEAGDAKSPCIERL